MAAEAGSIRGAPRQAISIALSPFATLLKFTIMAVVFLAVVGVIIIGGRLAINWYKIGTPEVAAARVGVAAEKPLSLIGSAFSKISPQFAALWEGNPDYQDTYSAEVEQNQYNTNLGVKIKEFKPSDASVLEGNPLKFTGTIIANSLAKEIELYSFCSLQDYEKEKRFPAQLTGNPTAQNNMGFVYKDQTNAEFTATCTFPSEAAVAEKARDSKKARLYTVYKFVTKGTQKIYLLDRDKIFELQGQDPFKVYKISDPQLTASGKIKSKTTDGPVNLAFGIDNPQPFTQDTIYELKVQLSNNLGWTGSLEKIESIVLQVPAVNDIEFVMEGEQGFQVPGESRCDFSYVGPGEQGYKLYEVNQDALEDVNRECYAETVRSLGLSEQECINLFKERPTFSCFVKPIKVPELRPLYGVIRAEATYVYSLDKSAIVEIRKLPEGVA